ncbi:MAG: hypothetical protein HY592_05785, partial [Candidatus Omnitrophica bacterium]|nr:hypothetical protein [Candidatus Omnitrophota bacterium]
MRCNPPFFKVIALFLILSFCAEQAGFAAAIKSDSGKCLPADALVAGIVESGERKSHLKWAKSVLPEIPQSVATIEDAWHPDRSRLTTHDSRLFILIQDAHTNTSGQINLAKVLDILLSSRAHSASLRVNSAREQLDSSTSLGMTQTSLGMTQTSLGMTPYVFVEAGVGDTSLSGLRNAGTPRAREIEGVALLRRGILHGEEYLNLTGERDFTIWGVEDLPLYLESIEAYRQTVSHREQFAAYLDRIENTIEALKPRVYNPLLLEFDKTVERYQNGEMPLTDYLKVLDDGKSFRRLDALKKFESRIDFKRAVLGHKGNLKRYFHYLKKVHALDIPRILEKQKILEEGKYQALATGRDERQLVRAARQLAATRKLFSFTLTPEELDAYQKDKKNIIHGSTSLTTSLTGFLNRKIMDLGGPYERALVLEEGFDEAAATAEKFYQLTHARDHAFIENTLKSVVSRGSWVVSKPEGSPTTDDSRLTTAVLITGGFHTPNLKRLLKQQGISYIVLTPQVLHETNQKRYERILLSQKIDGRLLASGGLGPIQSATRTWQFAQTEGFERFLIPDHNAARLSADRHPEALVLDAEGSPREILPRAARRNDGRGARMAGRRPAWTGNIEPSSETAAVPDTDENLIQNLVPLLRRARPDLVYAMLRDSQLGYLEGLHNMGLPMSLRPQTTQDAVSLALDEYGGVDDAVRALCAAARAIAVQAGLPKNIVNRIPVQGIETPEDFVRKVLYALRDGLARAATEPIPTAVGWYQRYHGDPPENPIPLNIYLLYESPDGYDYPVRLTLQNPEGLDANVLKNRDVVMEYHIIDPKNSARQGDSFRYMGYLHIHFDADGFVERIDDLETRERGRLQQYPWLDGFIRRFFSRHKGKPFTGANPELMANHPGLLPDTEPALLGARMAERRPEGAVVAEPAVLIGHIRNILSGEFHSLKAFNELINSNAFNELRVKLKVLEISQTIPSGVGYYTP